MSNPLQFKIEHLDDLKRAIKRNPRLVVTEAGKFLVRGMAEYRKVINRRPWRVNQKGGGVPTDTGNLRDTHKTKIKAFSAKIYPTARYAEYVHNGTSRLDARPWLTYAYEEAEPRIKILETKMLEKIVNDLAK